MSQQFRARFNGAIAAVVCVMIYAVALGVFIALTLLVASMEEGGGNLSESAPSLTQTIILLSEGIGFQTDSLTVTITPLLLTGLFIALLAACVRRLSADTWQSFISGAIAWQIMMLLIADNVTLAITDQLWMVSLKSFVVYSSGVLIATTAHSAWLESLRLWWHKQVSQRLCQTLRTGVVLGLVFLAIYLSIGIITTMVWIVANHPAMGRIFQLSGMHTGSRILTTICSLAWLPNLCIWAMSWVFGGGFVIGDLATFTLWTGESTSLPPLPVFGLLPTAVTSPQLRTTLLALPLIIAVILGLVILASRREFALRFISPQDGRAGVIATLVNLAYAAGSFCLTSIIVTLGAAGLFQLSIGSLGRQRLRHVGVDVMDSTRTLGYPTAMGLMASWLFMAIAIAVVYGFRVLFERFSEHDAAASKTDPEQRVRTSSSRPVSNGGPSSNTRVIISIAQRKEDHDDDNSAADT